MTFMRRPRDSFTVDRLRWDWKSRPMRALLSNPDPHAGRLSRPVARSEAGSLRWGWSADASPIWVRQWRSGVPSDIVDLRAEAAEALAAAGVVVPDLGRRLSETEVAVERVPWGPSSADPRDGAAAPFIEESLRGPLASGRLVIAGEAHVRPDGTLTVEDIGGIVRLEAVDRNLLREILGGLARRDGRSLRRVIESETGTFRSEQALVVKKCSVCLDIEWNVLSLTLALRNVSDCLLAGGSTSATYLRAAIDEMVARTALLERHPSQAVLRHPGELLDLLDQTSA